MATYDPNVDTDDANVSTLPPNVSGALPQAKARIGSPRSTGQAMGTLPYSNPDPTAGGQVPTIGGDLSGIGQALASGVRSLVGMQSTLSNPGATTSPATDLNGATPAPMQRNALAAYTPTYPPQAAAPAQPGAITRSGNSYSGTNLGAAPQSPLSTMTDAQRNNAPFAAAYGAMQAQDRVDAATQANRQQAMTRNANLAQNQYDARVAAQKTSRDADIANFESSITTGVGRGSARTRQLLADRAATANTNAQGELNAANTAAANGTPINALADLNQGQAYVKGGQEMAQNALTDPLHVAQLQQGLQAGGTQQKIAELTLRGHEREQNMLDQVASAKTPEERQALIGQVMALRGQPIYDVHVGAGGINPATGQAFPGQAFVSNRLTGEVRQVGGAQTPQAGGYGQHPEGSIVQDKAGKQYKIVNGQPVPQ